MHSKSSKWELGFVHYIAKFPISRFIISRFEYIYFHINHVYIKILECKVFQIRLQAGTQNWGSTQIVVCVVIDCLLSLVKNDLISTQAGNLILMLTPPCFVCSPFFPCAPTCIFLIYGSPKRNNWKVGFTQSLKETPLLPLCSIDRICRGAKSRKEILLAYESSN